MMPTLRHSVIFSVLLAGLLSACAPNPYILQDRVYGVGKAPAAMPSAPVVVKPPVSKPPVKQPQTTPQQDTAPEEEVSATPPEAVEVLTPKVYPSSPAVQALVKQADAEAAKGSLDKAADTIERALRIEADNPDLWMKLAKINEQQGNHEQAVSMVNKAQAYREQLN
jgi:TolA-binding protein